MSGAASGGIIKTMERTRNRDWGEPPWHAEPFQPRAAGKPPANADVAIIGGGFTGLSAAYHLAKRGVEVTLLEAESFGSGASGRTGGLVLEGTAAGIRPQAEDCIPFLQRLVSEHRMECGLELPGCWLIGHTELGSAKALPWHDYEQSIYVADTVAGGVVNPLALVLGLARIAEAAGARLYQNKPVRKFATSPLKIEVDGVRLEPRTLIIATNAWLPEMLTKLRIGIRSCLTFALATKPIGEKVRREIGFDEGHPFYTIDQPYLWGRTLYDGGLLVGGGLVYGPPDELEEVGTGDNDVRTVFERVEKRIHGLNPALADLQIMARWGGPIAFTSDYLPLIGRLPENPQIYVAGGYTGHGVALSVRAGAMLADAIVDGQPLPDWASPSRKSADN
jgi:gamma-glutamylputrescine oxidase